MSAYKKMAIRLVVLGGLIAGTVLTQPKSAFAFSCQSDCFAAYQQCRAWGLFGCQEIYVQCLDDCNGL